VRETSRERRSTKRKSGGDKKRFVKTQVDQGGECVSEKGAQKAKEADESADSRQERNGREVSLTLRSKMRGMSGVRKGREMS
jgi:hypothetical protein